MTIRKISIIGSGNVATHLGQALAEAGLNIAEVFSPDPTRAASLANLLSAHMAGSLSAMNKEADLYLLAVTDSVIGRVAAELPDVDGIVAHTSGNTPLGVLSRFKKYGVFYPLQTFTKDKETDMKSVPFCLEASGDRVLHEITALARRISNAVYEINSEQRSRLHLAAVFVNNFTNHLYHLADEYLTSQGLDFDLLKPLIVETARKGVASSPAAIQTGPARRGDEPTLQMHEHLLEQDQQMSELYKLITKQIRNRYHE